VIFSNANEENVVYPPQIPVARNNLSSGDNIFPLLDKAYTIPIIKQPKILTLKVPRGKEEG
jgi:hypothetical protein